MLIRRRDLLAASAAETAEKKIGLRLLILSDYVASEDPWLPLSHREIAAQLGLSMPTVQRALKRLEGRSALETGVPYFTTIQEGYAAIKGLSAGEPMSFSTLPLQDYYSGDKT